MSWTINISKNAEKFLVKNELTMEEVRELIAKSISFFQGAAINVDIKKLKGQWKGFYRIRSGRIRIIAELNFENSAVFIEEIDWRGNVYQ